MPTLTYIPLANITLSGTATSVSFSSINQGYRDLVLVASYFGSGAMINVRLNGDTSGSYFNVVMGGNGSTTYSYTDGTAAYIRMAQNATTGTPCNVILNFMDYSATDKQKVVLARNGRADSSDNAVAGRWGDTSAITTIALLAETGSFSAGSTFALYGIAA